ncbi:Thiol-disulfide isomerase or thioredoxin [Robiginitalea myxolifaciens]|uniref:Thiol-disulfide isomerase or thioredoxin n=1 Tax=Robiginitalea myxolifaciens TaxID=400055 RepID=A0A1I6H6A6_9FLAO|nr:TlpA disulfide reductase family protein [Robiginitalea myxolifaciens]SFR49968.1 Thiol-disulfide isomerase or thioredoxin [Robiginitalea myxolifaciens]
MNKTRRKTWLNILLIGLVLSFFVTPIGHWGKIALMQLFAFAPDEIPAEERKLIPTYDWTLKDAEWEFFNFDRSRGRVALINFWASWRLPSLPELMTLQDLYEDYGDRVDFYIITDEEREPVELFMEEHGFTFPVTYKIIGTPSPFPEGDPPRSFLIDRDGYIVVAKEGISDWDSRSVRELLDNLLSTP